MSFTVPAGWHDLSQADLRYIFRLLWLFGEHPDWQERVKTAALLHFCSLEVVNRTDRGWLCRKTDTSDSFLLDPALLPSMCERLDWLTRTEEMRVRLEEVGKFKAVDFDLRGLMFGEYLMAENYYQAFLSRKEDGLLVSMGRILYQVPDGVDVPEMKEEVLTGVFLWYAAVKNEFAGWFPNFFKPAGGNADAVSMESQRESMQAQIRLLTKGDVTKQKYILNETDTWTALAELDALAKEAEEIKSKYGKK